MSMTRENFKNLIDGILNESKRGSSNKNWAFLPEGTHTVRILLDPSEPQRLHRTVCVHYFHNITELCPDFLAEQDPQGEYPICELCALAEESGNRLLNRRFQTLVYMQILKTKSESKYWKSGELYAVIGNTKLRRALDEMISAIAEDDMDMLYRMLNHEVKGNVASLSFTKGAQGGVGIQVLTSNAEPFDADDRFKPLGHVWVNEEFNLANYTRSVSSIKKILLKEAEETTEEESAEKNEETTEEVSQNGKVEEKSLEETLPKKNSSTKKSEDDLDLKASLVIPLDTPDNVTLPEGCPGWGMYSGTNEVCLLCDYNFQCNKARKAALVK